MRRFWLLLLLIPCLLAQAQRSPLVVVPYLQVGPHPSPTSLEVWWVAAPGNYQVGYSSGPTRAVATPVSQPLGPHRLYRAALQNLHGAFDYQLQTGDTILFKASGRTLKPPGASCRYAIVGDTGCGTEWEKQNVYQMAVQKVDCGVILGDIVYDSGRQSEYLRYFFPVYNSDRAALDRGAPLLRSIPFMAAPGNHDVRPPGRETYSDGYAYFLYWSQPLNGPASGLPVFQPASARRGFEQAAGERYPRMATFSLDVGDVHWVMLDSNPEVDWSRADLRSWLAADLERAAGARWRFVALHHSPFSSGEHHFREQQVRLLAKLFEQGKVDLVFSGHMHNYQRTRPLKFDGAVRRSDGSVSGTLQLDRSFDGRKNTHPKGVIYVVSGGGGAYLHDEEKSPVLQPYTARMESQRHSFTVCEVTPSRVTLRQVTCLGKEIDRCILER